MWYEISQHPTDLLNRSESVVKSYPSATDSISGTVLLFVDLLKIAICFPMENPLRLGNLMWEERFIFGRAPHTVTRNSKS